MTSAGLQSPTILTGSCLLLLLLEWTEDFSYGCPTIIFFFFLFFFPSRAAVNEKVGGYIARNFGRNSRVAPLFHIFGIVLCVSYAIHYPHLGTCVPRGSFLSSPWFLTPILPSSETSSETFYESFIWFLSQFFVVILSFKLLLFDWLGFYNGDWSLVISFFTFQLSYSIFL